MRRSTSVTVQAKTHTYPLYVRQYPDRRWQVTVQYLYMAVTVTSRVRVAMRVYSVDLVQNTLNSAQK